MPNAKAPSGPGRPLQEREDAVAEQEGMAELEAESPAAEDPSRGARQAERDAHTGNDDAAGKSGAVEKGNGGAKPRKSGRPR